MSLYHAELSRFRHRRSIRNLFLACLILFTLGVLALTFAYQSTSVADVIAAKASATAARAQESAAYGTCLQQPRVMSLYVTCGLPIEDRNYDFTQYSSAHAFTLEVAMPHVARLLGIFFALIAFAVGATWIGGDWLAGSLAMAVLWTPDRLALIRAKIAVLITAVATCAVGLQLLWFAASLALTRFRGPGNYFVADWGQTSLLEVKLVAVAVVAALAGFAVAHLARNVIAPIGLVLGYVLAVEGAVRAVSPQSQKWLLSTSVNAFLSPHGSILKWGDGMDAAYLRVSQAPAGMTALVVVALLAASVTWFRRSDIA